MLIALGGLPGTGKSTLARSLAAQLGAVWLRIDSIEQAMRDAGVGNVGPAGYHVAYALAEDNLRLGHVVIADSVNPLCITRNAFRAVAARVGCRLLQVECICSDRDAHRHRVEARQSEVPGLRLPSWAAVTARTYEAWPDADLVLDTATLPPDEAVARIALSAGRA